MDHSHATMIVLSPLALKPHEGGEAVQAVMNIPAVAKSDLPGLLGLTALKNNRAVLDFTTMKLHFCGPGDIEMPKALPPGTETFQLETAPSGHLVLPCCEYSATSSNDQPSNTLTLMTRAPPMTDAEGRP